MEYLDPIATDEIYEPERYAAQRLASLSMKVIAISLALSRYVFMFQVLQAPVNPRMAQSVLLLIHYLRS